MSIIDKSRLLLFVGGVIPGAGASAGDLAALSAIVETKADRADTPKLYRTRAAAVAAGQSAIPPDLGRIVTVEGDIWVLRAPDASTDDPLFLTAPRWGVVQRMNATAALRYAGLMALVNVGGTPDAITADLPAQVVASGVGVTNLMTAVLVPAAENTGPVTLSVAGDGARRLLDNDGRELPPGYIQPNRILIVRRLLDGETGHWRILNDASEQRIVGGIRPDLNAVLTLATLADERAQRVEKALPLTMERFDALMERITALEATASQEQQPMTTYSLAATASTSAAVLVAAGPVTDLKVVNKSGTVTVGVAFGSPPATITDPGVLPLGPGGALSLDAIPATPIHIIGSGAADVAGTFSVPLNEPNPNWETDFQALVSRMVSAGAAVPSLPWQDAYRRLYSALRREGVLSRMVGIFVPAAHAQGAALVNWAGSNVATVGGGAPTFTAKSGFGYNGVADYHNTGVNLNAALGSGTSTNVAAAVWSSQVPVGTQRAALGDGGFELLPSWSASIVASRGWMLSDATEQLTGLPSVGFVGVSRSAMDRYTVYGPGGAGAVQMREGIVFLPNRPAFMGATNGNAGTSKYFNGTVRAAMLGRALSSVQMLAAQAAMTRYFRQIEAI